jgi:hypothetical protein
MPGVLHGDHDEHRRASCYGKRARLVRRGAVGKGPGQLAPRRRPTLPHGGFGERPGETGQRQRWNRAPGRLSGPHLVALVRAGAKFEKGVLIERPDEAEMKDAA